jgi:tRNA (guanine37-N1)-methyltransferase
VNISILTLFPDLYQEFLRTSLIGRAQERNLLDIKLTNLFDFCKPGQRIDSPTFGPGAGMILRPDVVEAAINQQELLHGKALRIFFSPQGEKIDQRMLKKLHCMASERKHLLLFASRYEGVDARVEQEYADLILSVGDFVLMGGDLPCMMLLEGLLRYVPGVVGRAESVEADSFSGAFVDYPEFTQPVNWHGHEVPEVVRSGNHQAIAQWRKDQAVEKTVKKHFNWLRQHELSTDDKTIAYRHIPAHYAALMHGDVLLKDQNSPGQTRVGTSSVTSFDLHDISRSSLTYGLKNYFIVTPLKDQQQIVNTLLDFWNMPIGINYNKHRHQAVSRVKLQNNIDEVIAQITAQEGKAPILIATSARSVEHVKKINFYDQSEVWQHNRPVLFLFGTAKGIAPHVVERCDYLLGPIEGFTDFNHLSVRSAAAIVFDRWLGLNVKNGV